VTTAATALSLSTNTPPSEDAEHHLSMNPAFRFAQRSPGQRVFVIDGPTSYICNPASNQILRYSNYAFSVAQPTPPGVIGEVVVSQLSDCNMTYNPGTSQRGGILTIEVEISDAGESINLLHQVHVVNVP
jgi:MSHA biogenesis protein MshO